MSTNGRWEVLVVTMPHRDNLFIEVWIENQLWAEVFLENTIPHIEVYPRQDGTVWRFRYEDLLAITQKIAPILASIRDLPQDSCDGNS